MTQQSELTRLVRRLSDLSRREAPLTVLRKGLDKLCVYGAAPWKQRTFGKRTFQNGGQTYRYFAHAYNATWRNERGVELALALDFVQECQGKELLELGNVLSYYDEFSNMKNLTIVDKYEKTPGVLNVDFMDFDPGKKFDAFVSVSTFEHIGWDESPRQPEKVGQALARIGELVRNPQQVLVSFPLGYNSFLDGLVLREELPFARVSYLLRKNERNDWEEGRKEDALTRIYNSKYPGANGLFVGIGLK